MFLAFVAAVLFGARRIEELVFLRKVQRTHLILIGAIQKEGSAAAFANRRAFRFE